MEKTKQRISKGLIFLVLLASLIGSGMIVKAEEDNTTSVVFGEKVEVYKVNAGDSFTVTVPVKSKNGTMMSPYITPLCDEKGILITSTISLARENMEGEPNNIVAYENTYVTFTVEVADTVATGVYELKLKFDYYDFYNNPAQPYTMVEPIKIRVTGKPEPTPTPTPSPTPEPKLDPVLAITNLRHDGGDELKKGDTFYIIANVKNIGELAAKTVQVSIEGYDTSGILKNYKTEKKELGALNAGGIREVSFPVYISTTATSGVKTLTMKVSGKTPSGTEVSETSTITITLSPEEIKSNRGEANLLIQNVKQSPSAPKAGGNLTLSYTLKNQGTADAKEIKIEPTLTNTTFGPVGAEPYKYIKLLKAGESITIKTKYIVSKQVVDGLNEIPLTITYKDTGKKNSNSSDKETSNNGNKEENNESSGDNTIEGGTGGTDGPTEELPEEVKSVTAKLYVLNVKNPEKKEEEKKSKGVPKLIIKEFTTGGEDIRAGKEFQFTFDINNTHSSLNANNIKVTLTSEENAFSVAKGSNSFYISTIKPGETSHQVISLRAKADCVTKAYPLKIDFEYEYDGMPQLENQISTGLSISETLNLQVLENSRPTVDNIMVGTWDPPTAYTPCNMSFDFRNLGKSTLYNVAAKLDSKDYTSTQQTVYIGNVEAGNGNTYEMEITPNVDSMEATGVLVVTYEDSNGNVYELKTDLPATFINSAQPIGNPDMGFEIPEQNVTPEKKEMIPMKYFIVIQVVIFLAGIVIFRKLVITIYKARLHKKEEKE